MLRLSRSASLLVTLFLITVWIDCRCCRRRRRCCCCFFGMDLTQCLPKTMGPSLSFTHTRTHTHTDSLTCTLLKHHHVVVDLPFVPSLCPVCKEIWVDVCDGRDPSQQTMSRLKRGFFLSSLRSLLVRCKFTWPLNSSPHKLLSFVQQLLFGHIRRHCCLGHGRGMLSLGVYVRRPF